MTDRSWCGWLILILLVVGTAILYWPMVYHPFISIADHQYIEETPHVNSGLTLPGVRWAFTTGYASNWHPVTWLSHMLDCELFGLNPGGHHFVNLLLHAINAALLFLMLRQLTGATYRAAFVAGLFAWHPLHVESVAWASERKDVLCAFFWFLATMAYGQYARERKPKFYGLMLLLFGLGLMSKPMLVTFPFVLLLLDVWPLQRCQLPSFPFRATPIPAEPPPGRETWPTLIREKIPLFAMAVASSVVTYLVQSRGGAVSSLHAISPVLRFENAVISYARYTGKTFWPAKLAAIYPYPKNWPLFSVLGAIALLGLVSIGVLMVARRRGYLAVGWLWFLGTLVPTIGLVQVGSQSMADRYTYIPAIGLFLMIVWGLSELVGKRSLFWRPGMVVVGMVLLLACGIAARQQLATWSSSEALFRHALAVTRNNYIALDGLGSALDRAGRPDEALKLIQESVRLEPQYPEAQYDLGTLLMRRGDFEQAIPHLLKAIEDNPKFAAAHSNLGTTYLRQGRVQEAEPCFRQALALEPANAEAHYNLATLLLRRGQLDETVTHLLAALRREPNYVAAHANLAVALMRQGKTEPGLEHFRTVARLDPGNAENQFNLGLACLNLGRYAEAEQSFRRASELNSSEAKYFHRLGVALARQKKYAFASTAYHQALKLRADSWEIQADLAWLLATANEATVRNGEEALGLGARAAELTGHTNTHALMALAAAQAEAGQFGEGASTAEVAWRLARQENQAAVVSRAEQLLSHCKSQQPLRE